MSITLSENRYANRSAVREKLNSLAELGFAKSRRNGWSPYIKADIHVVDRLYDREFPVEEFFKIVSRLVNSKESEILKRVQSIVDGEEKAVRINCYGHGNLMLGVTLKVYEDAIEGIKSYHVDIRTCYAERNMVHRCRSVEVDKIWCMGMPKWIKNPEPYVERED